MARPELLQPDNNNSFNERNHEVERYTVVRLRPLDRENESDLKAYFELLTHPKNREHFASPPKDYLNLRDKLNWDDTKVYLAENSQGEIVGGGGINDAEEGQHDHWLVKAAVDPDLQERGIGKQMLALLIEEAFTTKTSYDTDRTKLDASVIRDVEGWWRMPRLLQSLGFRPLHIMLNEVDIYVQELGKTVRKPTERWEIMKEDWGRVKRRSDVRNIVQRQTNNPIN